MPGATERRLLLWVAATVMACSKTSVPTDGTAMPTQSAKVADVATAIASSKPPTASPKAAPALRSLEGKWRIETSSGGPDHGYVFWDRIGQIAVFSGDTLTLPGDGGDRAGPNELRKTIEVVDPSSDPLQIVVTHRGNFSRASTSDEDESARNSPNSKGWSRNGIIRVDGDSMKLAVSFPQDPRPVSFDAKDGVEVVTLRRVGTAKTAP